MVINNLESTSTTDSLSANMGRELNEYITGVEEFVADIDDRVTTLENSDVNISPLTQTEIENIIE